MSPTRHLFVPSKLSYVRGVKPKVDCILCEVVDGRDTVERLDVFRDELFVVSLNLHPYNPGHLMIFPRRHIERLDALDPQEVTRLHQLQVLAMDVLGVHYSPQGFNVGYNLGSAGGASIPHLHLHVVPRYRNEVGFMDLIGGARIIVEDPRDTSSALAAIFAEKTGGIP